MKGDDIAARLLRFATNIVKIVSGLPKLPITTVITRQLLRSGTAGGANYEEARSAESRLDFAHKVLVAAKEVGESRYWLQLLESTGLSSDALLGPTIQEGKELTRILMASARTAKRSA